MENGDFSRIDSWEDGFDKAGAMDKAGWDAARAGQAETPPPDLHPTLRTIWLRAYRRALPDVEPGSSNGVPVFTLRPSDRRA